MAQPYWWDEQWTISVQHTEADIDKHLAAFEEIAPALAKAQQERGGEVVGAQLRRTSSCRRRHDLRSRLASEVSASTSRS